ncbi:hypothetical protein BDV29DRAFT_183890 [Aspergillus leporis]|uniref:Rhodopsin domain-containing protein n=1 Tax=Aspergillus leporis TaxID=41062 RepID=A0A5N5WND1_9EURO|nr:hypothetical protein BDV29DRAFT_183890 [Aspergillus leporis]
MTVFIRNITLASRDRILAHIAQGCSIVFAVIALFGSAFQCHLPRTWDYLHGTCIDTVTWTTFIALTSAITDIIILIQAILLVGHVQTAWKKKIMFASIVLPRILYVFGLVYGTRTMVLASNASGEWESAGHSSEIRMIQETRTWTMMEG